MFEALADDMVDFAKAVAMDFLQLLDTLLGQITSWLAQPVDIPFVAGLYQALTGDQLSLLDLICLIAAVPATILLDVITGSPTVPDTVAAGTVAATAAGPGRTWVPRARPPGRSCSAWPAPSSASPAR